MSQTVLDNGRHAQNVLQEVSDKEGRHLHLSDGYSDQREWHWARSVEKEEDIAQNSRRYYLIQDTDAEKTRTESENAYQPASHVTFWVRDFARALKTRMKVMVDGPGHDRNNYCQNICPMWDARPAGEPQHRHCNDFRLLLVRHAALEIPYL